MKVLVLGAGGQIGREVCRAAWPPRYAVLPRDQDEVDITKSAAVTATLARERRDRSVRDGVPNSAAIPLPTAFFGAKFPLPENTAKSCQDIDNTVFFASGGDSPGAEMRFFRCRQRKKEPARPNPAALSLPNAGRVEVTPLRILVRDHPRLGRSGDRETRVVPAHTALAFRRW